MRKDTENEMEQIQKGLERFLEREVDGVREDSRSEDEEELWEADAEDGEEESDFFTEDEEEDSFREEEDFSQEDEEEVPVEKKKISRREAEDRSMGRRREQKEENQSGRTGKKKKHSGLKKFLIFILILLVIFFGGLYLAVGVVYDQMNYEQNESVSGPLKENGVTSVLLIGSDSRTSGTEGRSDAMILITISDRTKTVHMTSLLRDMYVEIPGYEGNRLNAAYAYGGPELLMETINQNLGTEVYHYAVVNFEAFANLVDAVGGVELELTNEEVQWVNA